MRPVGDAAEATAAQGAGGAVPMHAEVGEAGDIDMDAELEPGEQPLVEKKKISGEAGSPAQQAGSIP